MNTNVPPARRSCFRLKVALDGRGSNAFRLRDRRRSGERSGELGLVYCHAHALGVLCVWSHFAVQKLLVSHQLRC